MNEKISNLLVNTFADRSIQVITAFGLADPFTTDNGIDQGDVISPLIWRIVYDPLLTFISSKEHLGFHFAKDISLGSLAYVDDTGWLADSKEHLQAIMDHASDFFCITDIELNLEKCDLLVINKAYQAEHDMIYIGSDR